MENQTGFWKGGRIDRPIQTLQIPDPNPIGFEGERELTVYFNVFFQGIGVFFETISTMELGAVVRAIVALPIPVLRLLLVGVLYLPVGFLFRPDRVRSRLVRDR
jgi:hypothetical protein